MADGADGRAVLGYCDRLTYRQGELVDVRASGRGQVEVSLDDVMVVCTPGGGGYGQSDQ